MGRHDVEFATSLMVTHWCNIYLPYVILSGLGACFISNITSSSAAVDESYIILYLLYYPILRFLAFSGS